MTNVEKERPILLVTADPGGRTFAEQPRVGFDRFGSERLINVYIDGTDTKFMQDGSSRAY